jgi:hypothetical protein
LDDVPRRAVQSLAKVLFVGLVKVVAVSNAAAGMGFPALGTVGSRNRSFAGRSATKVPLRDWPTDSSMFDWPEQRNTSPTRTSDTISVAPESVRTSRLNGPPASSAGSVAVHRPDSSARPLVWRPANATETSSPAPAVTQIGIGRPRCATA